jgi:hypothetical protein
LSLRSNPGLELANAFGVNNLQLANACGVNNLQLANAFGVNNLELANAFGVIHLHRRTGSAFKKLLAASDSRDYSASQAIDVRRNWLILYCRQSFLTSPSCIE